MTMNEMKRMTQVGRRTWNALTNAEKDAWYCDTGTYGFIECIADILHIDISNWSADNMDYVEAQIVK